MTDNKSCENCRYFMQHYVWSANAISKANCGHCKLNTNPKKPVKNICIHKCEKWEPRSIRKQEQKENIKKILLDMSERIKQLVIYFEEDI